MWGTLAFLTVLGHWTGYGRRVEGWRRWCLGAAALVVLLLAAWPGAAGARQDDPPVEGRSPADGAVVQDATSGLRVQFSCPAYHPTQYDQVRPGDGEGYHVILATAGAVGVDGMLLGPARVDTRDAVVVDGVAGICTAVPDADERGLLPREPGTYWWQPYRDCATYLCPFAEEVGDPVRVVVRETVCSASRTALRGATRELAAARKSYRSHRTTARRDRVARLAARITQLRARLHVVYNCKM
jgi:hypothetical protein